jgi:hypothetical protein
MSGHATTRFEVVHPTDAGPVGWRLRAAEGHRHAAGPCRKGSQPDWRDVGDRAPGLDHGAGGQLTRRAVGYFRIRQALRDDAQVEVNPKAWVSRDALGLAIQARHEEKQANLEKGLGYFTDEDYYVVELRVKGLPTLRRGQEFVSAGGVVHGARLERKLPTVKKLGNWD